MFFSKMARIKAAEVADVLGSSWGIAFRQWRVTRSDVSIAVPTLRHNRQSSHHSFDFCVRLPKTAAAAMLRLCIAMRGIAPVRWQAA